MKAIKSIAEKNKSDAKAMLLEAAEKDFDTVIILGFWADKHQFSIRSSSMHQRLELLGALREAEHHVINSGAQQI